MSSDVPFPLLTRPNARDGSSLRANAAGSPPEHIVWFVPAEPAVMSFLYTVKQLLLVAHFTPFRVEVVTL